MKLSVVIVSYNVCYFLEQALLSVRRAAADLPVEVFVVDNASVDGSVEMVRRKFPEVILMANAENVGFSRANNQAMRQARGEYVLLLNPDTVVEEDTFLKCCRFMDEHPDAGGLGVRMLDGAGKFLPESKRGLPTPWVAFYKVFGLAALFPHSRRFGQYHLTYLDEHETHAVEVLSGAFMLMRKAALDRVGLLDEDYFMYGEDIDLSYRLTKGGYRNYYFPDTRIIHYKGESTKRTSVNYVFVFYRAMIIFARKHFSSQHAGVFSALIHLAIYLRAGLALLRRWAHRLAWPLADATLIWVGMYFLKSYWEVNHKRVPDFYPPDFMQLVVPAYILVWLGSVYFSGGYDGAARPGRLVRGVVVGTVLISALSNFFNDYRFSRALILLGGAWTTGALVGTRLLWHLVRFRNLAWGEEPTYRVAVVGSPQESSRVLQLVRRARPRADVLGYLTPAGATAPPGDEDHLGDVSQAAEVARLYQLDEFIFCARDLTTRQIIGWMSRLDNPALSYKIVPAETDYIIGSNSKNVQGDLYTLRARLAIAEPANRRGKRLLDVLLSIIFLLLAPLVAWFAERPGGLVRNSWRVLTGQRTWVGFSKSAPGLLPRLRRGVLTPATGLGAQPDGAALRRLDVLYAKDYRPATDVEIIRRGFSQLGSA